MTFSIVFYNFLQMKTLTLFFKMNRLIEVTVPFFPLYFWKFGRSNYWIVSLQHSPSLCLVVDRTCVGFWVPVLRTEQTTAPAIVCCCQTQLLATHKATRLRKK